MVPKNRSIFKDTAAGVSYFKTLSYLFSSKPYSTIFR
jgi:hypothetical protein